MNKNRNIRGKSTGINTKKNSEDILISIRKQLDEIRNKMNEYDEKFQKLENRIINLELKLNNIIMGVYFLEKIIK